MSNNEETVNKTEDDNQGHVSSEQGGVEDASTDSQVAQASASTINKSKRENSFTSVVSPAPHGRTAKNLKAFDVFLRPAGDAPIMKKKKWAVDRNKRISWIGEFIKKYLKVDAKDSLFLYVNQSFAPAPDTQVGTVFDCFGSDGKLVLHYCRTQAWG